MGSELGSVVRVRWVRVRGVRVRGVKGRGARVKGSSMTFSSSGSSGSLLTAYYSTYYSLPTTYYLLPTTYYLLLTFSSSESSGLFLSSSAVSPAGTRSKGTT